ncbi:lipoyl synthase [Prochlorococcus sp. MIT 1341]|uniref:lipoyl synthase n=1 Tax=Prochlorococcus sp. MIT 1341 TaxID=3096221 RepID=UPI002A7642C9|nr:lipoyl synthase [Prochlorococcus sp. MIT 1341]
MSIGRKETRYSHILPSEKLPLWLRRSIGRVSELERVDSLVKESRLHTICEEGRCPNRAECYSAGTATFLLGGSICTRSCAFCQVEKGTPPQKIDPLEAERVAKAVIKLGLRYVVLTSVARDDLQDHGASLFTSTIAAIRRSNPLIAIEVLTPDFWGGTSDFFMATRKQKERLKIVLSAKPVCFNHNLETVQRLQGEVRRGATYEHSLSLLKYAKEIAPQIPTKSGLMLGLGEEFEEVIQTLKDLREVDCQRVTFGQYLRPSLAHIPVYRYWTPDEFSSLREIAIQLGFSKVSSGPLVRSSYHAEYGEK